MNRIVKHPSVTIAEARLKKEAARKYGRLLLILMAGLAFLVFIAIPLMNAFYNFNPGNQ